MLLAENVRRNTNTSVGSLTSRSFVFGNVFFHKKYNNITFSLKTLTGLYI